MAYERNGYKPLPVTSALEALPKISGKQFPGVEVPKHQLTGNLNGERLLLVANQIGASHLTGDPTITSLRLSQIEIGGDTDTLLEVRRQDAQTELVLSGGRASVIKDNPGVSYSETPAGPRDEAWVRRVLVNIAALQ